MKVTSVQFFSLGLNIVYTKVGGDSSAGPLPTVKLSRRERYSQMSIYIQSGNLTRFTQVIVYKYLFLL